MAEGEIKLDAPSPPPVPDPVATATAQGEANNSTAAAQTALNNANVYSPLGSSTYKVTGSTQVTEPDGSISTIPTYTNTQTLSPAEQRLFNEQTQLGSQENRIAGGALANVNQALQQPVNLQTNVQGAGNFQGETNQAIAAAQAQMAPQLNQEQEALTSQLASQGIPIYGNGVGTAGYNAQEDFGQQENLANAAAVGIGDTEQATLANEALQQGQFHNTSALAAQNQPINEVTALMSGGQVSMPQFAGYNPAQTSAAPISQDTYASANLANQQYAEQAQMQASDLGALAGLGGSALRMFSFASSPELKQDHGVVGKVGALDVHSFNYNGDQTPLRGFMADEVAKVVPDAVKTVKGGPLKGFKSVDYAKALRNA